MTNCAGRCWRSSFVFCPRLLGSLVLASWGGLVGFLPGPSPWGLLGCAAPCSFRFSGSRVLARLWDGPVFFCPDRPLGVCRVVLRLPLSAFRAAGFCASLGTGLFCWTGVVSLGFLPGPSPWYFYAARLGRMRSRRTRVAYQAARLAAMARSSCGYWPPCGRTAAISRSNMWACASFPFTRSNSVSSK